MKKYFIIAMVAVLFASCATTLDYMGTQPEEINWFYLDLTKYADKGFYFSPRDINQNYKVLGEIEVNLRPKRDVYFDYKGYGNDLRPIEEKDSISFFTYKYNTIPIHKIFDKTFEQCEKQGGNGLLFYKLNITEGNHSLSGTLIKTE